MYPNPDNYNAKNSPSTAAYIIIIIIVCNYPTISKLVSVVQWVASSSNFVKGEFSLTQVTAWR